MFINYKTMHKASRGSTENDVSQTEEEIIKEVLCIPIEYKINSDYILKNLQNQKYKIYLFERSYNLLTIKQKKKNKFKMFIINNEH